MDNRSDESASAPRGVRIETARFGPFDLQVGIDAGTCALLHQRVLDAQERFIRAPLLQVASRLEQGESQHPLCPFPSGGDAGGH